MLLSLFPDINDIKLTESMIRYLVWMNMELYFIIWEEECCCSLSCSYRVNSFSFSSSNFEIVSVK